MDWLMAPFEYAFMQHALLAATMIATTCAILGVFVVLRQMTFFGDAIAHATLPGILLAYLQQWSLFLGALVAAILSAIGIGFVSQSPRLRTDTAIGVVFSGMLAMGVVMMSQARSYRDFTHILFGNILGVTRTELLSIGMTGLVVTAFVGVFYKELLLTSFDPHHSQTIGLSTQRMRMAFLLMLSLTVVVGVQSVGVLLTTSLMITPAATAALVTRRLSRMIFLSVAVGCTASVVGLYASFYWNVASGGAIVLVCTLEFVAAMIVTRHRRQ